jgi:hypothetical protein
MGPCGTVDPCRAESFFEETTVIIIRSPNNDPGGDSKVFDLNDTYF